MIIRLEIYVVDPATNTMVDMWRRTMYDFKTIPVGMEFLLFTKERQKWLFPESGVAKGEHYDTNNDAYVVWAQFSQAHDFQPFGFDQIPPERWT